MQVSLVDALKMNPTLLVVIKLKILYFYSLVASYPVMVLFSAMIGAAILAHYYDNYNVVEATMFASDRIANMCFFGFLLQWLRMMGIILY